MVRSVAALRVAVGVQKCGLGSIFVTLRIATLTFVWSV